jgi:hypothetical protein
VIPRFANVATPLTAVAVAVPTRVPPAEMLAETTEELFDVRRFPLASLIETTG